MRGERCSSSSSSSIRGWGLRPKDEDAAGGRRWRSRSPPREGHSAAGEATAVPLKRRKEEPGFVSAAAAAKKEEPRGRVKEEGRTPRRRRQHERDDGGFEWGGREATRALDEQNAYDKPALRPNFEPSGLLEKDEGAPLAAPLEKNGVPLKHTPPEDEHMPDKKWRLYEFKKANRKSLAKADEEPSKVMHIHRRTSFLLGKDERVCDITLLHPTISKQHAVLQFRKRSDGVVPYLIDLESTNGTFLNGERILSARYVELREGDTVRFGKSSREFVLLHSGSVDVHVSYEDFLKQQEAEKKQQQQQQQQQQ
ncbi:hypothetical protein Esti_005211 [Eimeria stiedai]